MRENFRHKVVQRVSAAPFQKLAHLFDAADQFQWARQNAANRPPQPAAINAVVKLVGRETNLQLKRLRARGVFASVFVVTSADRLYRDLRGSGPWLQTLVEADEEDVPVVSVLDGHSHALAFIGAALGVPQLALGVDDFGQSGSRPDLYRHYGIDAAAIARAAQVLVCS